jgi:glycosyltransferase involved in cell wall biosynthesis
MSLGSYRGMGRYLRMLIAGRESSLLGLSAAGETDPDLPLVARGVRFHPLWEQVCVPRLLQERKIEVYLAPYNTAPLRLPPDTRLVLVVHDLIFMEPLPPSRSLYQNAGRMYRRIVAPHAIRRADMVVTVSQHTARQLTSRFDVDEQRLRVIPNAVSPEWFGNPAEPREQAQLVLAVAGEAPSKNLHSALAAFALCAQRMRARGLRMKVAGVKPAFHAPFLAHANSLGVGATVEFLPYLSDEHMRGLYREADVLLMPSLAEGFGIPVAEAMACGVPVAASHATSLPEVGGDAAQYFNPQSVEEMAAVLRQVLEDYTLRRQMSERGRMQARRFHPHAVQKDVEIFWRDVEQMERETAALMETA